MICVLTGFRFRAPENPKIWKPGIPPRDDVLEIGPEWRRFRRDGCRDAGGETGPEVGKLAGWGGESGGGPAGGVGIRVPVAPGFQIFRFSDSHESGR